MSKIENFKEITRAFPKALKHVFIETPSKIFGNEQAPSANLDRALIATSYTALTIALPLFMDACQARVDTADPMAHVEDSIFRRELIIRGIADLGADLAIITYYGQTRNLTKTVLLKGGYNTWTVVMSSLLKARRNLNW